MDSQTDQRTCTALDSGAESVMTSSDASLSRVAPPPAAAPAQWPAAPTHVTIIQPPSGWQLIDVAELWRFRELLCFLIWRDVKVRYKQTVLGAAWAVLQPAMMMVVFNVFFARMTKVQV